MRKWINLFETSDTFKLFEDVAVPSFVDHITDDLVDEVIRTGKWVDHGSDLDDTWEQGSFEGIIEDVPDGFWELPYYEVKDTPEFRKCVHTALANMANQAYEELIKGCLYEKLPPLTDSTVLYRGITGEFDPSRPLGVYWSISQTQAAGRFADDGKLTPGYCMTTVAGHCTIDWEGTIRSRLDYGNGADEAEIKLVKGSTVMARLYRVTFKDGWKPILTFVRDLSASA